MKLIFRAVKFPENLLAQAESFAKSRRWSFSTLVREAVAEMIGFKEDIEVAPAHGAGGDLARYKTAETHARVCEKMREAKAIKHVREEAKKRIAAANKHVERGAA